MVYRLIRFLTNLFINLSVRLDLQGMENLPASGGYIVVSNHLGRLDVPLSFCLLDRDDIIMLVAEKYYKFRIIRWIARKLDVIWIDRFNADLRALRVALSRLKNGGVLVISPEGTRSSTGALIAGRAGASYLAVKTGLPVIPVGVTGTEDKVVKEHFRRLKRPKFVIRIGAPFKLAALDNQNRTAGLQAYTDEIMCQIAALLPSKYQGVYVDHPRLQSLLLRKQTQVFDK